MKLQYNYEWRQQNDGPVQYETYEFIHAQPKKANNCDTW